MKNLKDIVLNKRGGNKILDSFNISYCLSLTTSFLDNIKDKKVLVLGSGPSAREIDWVNKDWDVLVTTSRFYQVPEILEQKPIHVTLSNQLNLEDKRLTDYLDNNPKCTIGFEVLLSTRHSILSPQNLTKHPLKWPNFKEKYKDRIMYYQIFIEDYTKQIGVGARVCYPVLMAKPKSLTLCGIDGFSKNPKEDPPNYFRKDYKSPDWGKGNHPIKNNYNNYIKDYKEFADKLYTIGHHYNIPIHNLGKGKPYNMITSISEKYEKS